MTILIYYFNIKQMQHDLSCYHGFVSEEKVIKISRFRNINDAALSLFGEILVRYGIKEITGLSNTDIQIMNQADGKPYAFFRGNQIFFNISHSKDYVICGIDYNEIGIDIEYITDIDLSVADLIFSDTEKEQLMTLDGKEQLSYFYQIWTLKESFVKYTGKGLTDNLNQIIFEYGEEIRLYHKNCFFQSNLTFTKIQIAPKYKCHVCHQGNSRIEKKELSEAEIINSFQKNST